METYLLTIKTNDRFREAKTDDTVQVKITGTSGNATDWKTLDHFFENDFEVGAKRDYTVTHFGLSVGSPVILTFRMTGWNADKNWLVDDVVVKYNDQLYEFPIYKWVENDELSVTLGKACLPQNVTNDSVKAMRASEIKYNKNYLPWNDNTTSEDDLGFGLPRYLKVDQNKDVPRIYRLTNDQSNRATEAGLQLAVNFGVNLFIGPKEIKELDDYRKMYFGTGQDDPPFIEDWKRDSEFGRQVLTGISPTAFVRCTKLPKNCNVTQDHVGNMLETGKTLDSEMAAGKIYIADYSYAADIDRNWIPFANKQFECTNCIGLFYVTASGDFLPIAIQLVPGDVESVFTSTDESHDWLLAKIYFRSTQSAVHEWTYHYLLTHALSETFSVATFRNLPHCHPLYKLLRPHLSSVCNINEQARKLLLPKNALANQAISLSALGTIRRSFKNFDLSHSDITQDLKSRGVDDADLLPNYHYRDDGLDIWNAIKSYVSNVVNFFYKNNKDVKKDFELQGWASDLANEGFAWQDGNTRGMPETIKSVDELIRICTIIIFSSSAQHAAVNFGQMETYQFIPNAPASMIMPPHKKGEGSLKRILDSLPGIGTSNILLTFAFALSKYSNDEIFLGDRAYPLFVEDEVKGMQNDFRADLNKLGLKFYNRNKTLKYPYWYLMPDKIPIDINI